MTLRRPLRFSALPCSGRIAYFVIHTKYAVRPWRALAPASGLERWTQTPRKKRRRVRHDFYGEVTHIRFTADELASLKAIAERDGVTVSEVVWRLVRANAGHLPIASEALRPAIVEMTDQLRRVGINFNQAGRAMNDGRVAHDEDLEQALIAVGDLVRQFRDELKAMTGRCRKAREAKP